MEESNFKKTAFRIGSMDLYKFTHMKFGLSYISLRFCCLMEQCLGDQQFVILMLYLEFVCVAMSVNDMLDWIELVFNRLKQFDLKIKPKNAIFFNTSVLFHGKALFAEGISANPENVDLSLCLSIGLCLRTSKKLNPF